MRTYRTFTNTRILSRNGSSSKISGVQELLIQPIAEVASLSLLPNDEVPASLAQRVAMTGGVPFVPGSGGSETRSGPPRQHPPHREGGASTGILDSAGQGGLGSADGDLRESKRILALPASRAPKHGIDRGHFARLRRKLRAGKIPRGHGARFFDGSKLHCGLVSAVDFSARSTLEQRTQTFFRASTLLSGNCERSHSRRSVRIPNPSKGRVPPSQEKHAPDTR